MWHQKSPRAITQLSGHCHLMWQTAPAAVAAAVAHAVTAKKDFLGHTMLPNY